MMFSFAAFALVSALTASAADINVRVGDGGLVFNPSSVMAQLGDTVHFQFVSKNHSVTESSFATPCVQAGVDSGFLAVDANSTLSPSWSFTLNTTTPLWFHCAQTVPVSHCQSGMVFAVNPTADKTFAAYQNNANNSASSGAAAGASGVAGASGSGSATPAPSSLPSGSSSAAISFPTGSPSGSGFSTALGTSTAAAVGGTAAAASVAPTTNGAVVVGTAKSVVGVTLFAAVAGFLL